MLAPIRIDIEFLSRADRISKKLAMIAMSSVQPMAIHNLLSSARQCR